MLLKKHTRFIFFTPLSTWLTWLEALLTVDTKIQMSKHVNFLKTLSKSKIDRHFLKKKIVRNTIETFVHICRFFVFAKCRKFFEKSFTYSFQNCFKTVFKKSQQMSGRHSNRRTFTCKGKLVFSELWSASRRSFQIFFSIMAPSMFAKQNFIHRLKL